MEDITSEQEVEVEFTAESHGQEVSIKTEVPMEVVACSVCNIYANFGKPKVEVSLCNEHSEMNESLRDFQELWS